MKEKNNNSFPKRKVRTKSFKELKIVQGEHTKVNQIHYDFLGEPQDYLNSKLSRNKLSKLLFNLCCKTIKNIKDNFHKQVSNK